jgi:hypothetical protein
LGSETVQIISAKLNRRPRKFEALNQSNSLQSGWVQHIQDIVTSAHGVINEHWQDLVYNTQANIDTTEVQNIQPEADLDLHLAGLDSFLAHLASRQRNSSSSTFYPTSEYPGFTVIRYPAA